MRYSANKPPKTRSELDAFVRGMGLNPYGVVEYKGRDIFIAESDLETDQKHVSPFGYWQTMWFTTAPNSDEKMDMGRWIDFDAFHDQEQGWTAEAKRKARIQSTVEDAERWIDKNIEKGRFDA